MRSPVRIVALLLVMLVLGTFRSVHAQDHGIRDTVRIQSIAQVPIPSTFELRVSVMSDEALAATTIPLVWNRPDIEFIDSAVFVGSMMESWTFAEATTSLASSHQQILLFTAVTFEPYVTPGIATDSLYATLRFNVPAGASDGQMTVDTMLFPPSNSLILAGSPQTVPFGISPEFVRGIVGIGNAVLCDCPKQGDWDANGIINLVDVVSVINYVFRLGPPPVSDSLCPTSRADVAEANMNNAVNIMDVVALIDYVFRSGAAPDDPCQLASIKGRLIPVEQKDATFGDVRIALYRNDMEDWYNDEWLYAKIVSGGDPELDYQLSGIPAGDYFLDAWEDVNHNAAFDAGDHWGWYNGEISGQGTGELETLTVPEGATRDIDMHMYTLVSTVSRRELETPKVRPIVEDQ